ncbi:iron-containing alcohol dehydrogenase [Lachnoclostridium pacaense]|uniref:iron-containing alcohol dehydrogenase n=1 Tax=Enterocloster hominis (ex Hitch et al. 2024) TaxID=1917870 RepID=UPI001D0F5E91|nr:iron-containing alcohol dehydrogenase [Lachnoclostridium pacaense]MCC2876265.1 iron-containing alcohol dehydrogenase [Lachnoclostridium pacaense]
MFEIVNNRQVIFGENKISDIPSLLKWYGCKKVFFATYSSSADSYHKIAGLLEEAGIGHVCYDQVAGEPDLHMINGGRDIFLAEGCDCTLALGGGSVIDTAKAIGMLAVNGGNVEDYQMNGKQVTAVPPLFIAVPTTSGTGAEATKTSVVLNNYNGLKKSLYHTTMIADIVILDPTLTTGLPRHITAATGMDALSHAIESYVSLNASPLTEMYGLKAIELINKSLKDACDDPQNLKARGDMMLGSYLGGLAITAGIGIAHIMAQPLGAMYKIPHGDACSIFLPAAMELNMDHAEARYARIAEALGVAEPESTDRENARRAVARVRAIREEIEAPVCLAPYIKETPDMDFIIDTVKKTTGHITCNPCPLTEQLMKDAFEKAMEQ